MHGYRHTDMVKIFGEYSHDSAIASEPFNRGHFKTTVFFSWSLMMSANKILSGNEMKKNQPIGDSLFNEECHKTFDIQHVW